MQSFNLPLGNLSLAPSLPSFMNPVHCSASPCSASPLNRVTRPNALLLHGLSSFSSASLLSFSTSSCILSSFSPITQHQRKHQRIRVLVVRESFSPVALDEEEIALDEEEKEGHVYTGQFSRHEGPSSGAQERVWWSPKNNEEGYAVPARYMKRLPWEVEQPNSRIRPSKSSDSGLMLARERHDHHTPQSYQGKTQSDGPSWRPQKLQDRASQWSPDYQQDRASWSPGKQQGRALRTPRRQQERGSWAPDYQEDRASWSSQRRRFTGPGQPHKRDSFLSQNQQMPFQKHAGPKMERKIAPRLQNRSPVFEQVAQPEGYDTFSRIWYPALGDWERDEDDVFRADSSYSRGLSNPSQGLTEGGPSGNENPQHMSQGVMEGESLGNGSPQDGSLHTSKLEEILSRFMPKHLNTKGQNEGGKRSIVEANRAQASEAKTARGRDMEGSGDANHVSRSISTSPGKGLYLESIKDNGRSSNAEDRNKDPSRDKISAFGSRNDDGLESAPGNMFTSSPSSVSGLANMGSKVHTLSQKMNMNGAFMGRSSRSPSTHASPTGSSSDARRPSFIDRNSGSSRSKYSKQESMKGKVQRPHARKEEQPGFEWTDSDSEDDARNAFSIASDTEMDGGDDAGDVRDGVDDPGDVTDGGDDAGDVLSIASGVGKEDTYSTFAQASKHSDQHQPPLSLPSTGMTEVPRCKKAPSWQSHSIPGIPFEFQFSYSETPAAPILRYRERPFSPFGPETMGRPWTGRAPLKPSKKKVPEFDSFKPPPRKKGVKYVQDPGPFPEGQNPKQARLREEILGEPLTNQEIALLVDKCQTENRQLNLGRDGLTHNMLDLIHSHWKRRRVCKIRCLGVPTLNMDNVCFHLEDKTGGKIIYQSGGVVYLYRGRYYNYKDRPGIPIMLWKPATPVYPKLIQPAPGGLTEEEANKLREIGKKIEPICSLVKNGVYLTLVKDVRDAFKIDPLVRIDCRGLNPSDYKKIGGKLKDLVPCVLLSFDDEQILMWKGQEKAAEDGTPEAVKAAEGSESEAVEPSDISDVRCFDAVIMEDVHGADCQSSEASSHYLGDIGAGDPEHLDVSISWSSDEEAEEVDAITDIGVDADAINATKDVDIGEGYESDENSREDIAMSSLSLEMDGEVDGEVEGAGDGEGQGTTPELLCVDALWDNSITSGMAIVLDVVHADSDLVAKKAGELALAAPVMPLYSLKLLNKLRIRKARPLRDQRELDKELYKLHDMRRRKKQRKIVGGFRLPSVGAPQTGAGLPVDALARLLSVK